MNGTELEMDALRVRLAELEARVAGINNHPPGLKSRFRSRGMKIALLTGGLAIAGVSVIFGQAGALFISPQGNVGIGNTAPTQRLDVSGTVRSSAGGFQFPDGSTQAAAAFNVPAGAVIAFNAAGCPSGWSDYTPAWGRFIRGIDKSGQGVDPDGVRSPGSAQGDAMRNITGALTGVEGMSSRAWPGGFKPGIAGAFSVPKGSDTFNARTVDYNPAGGVGQTAYFNAAAAFGVVVANENRPKNVALLYCQKN